MMSSTFSRWRITEKLDARGARPRTRRVALVWGDEEVVARVLATGERTVVLRQATDARYLPTGHLVFMRQSVPWAVRFDPAQCKTQGVPVALQEGIAQPLAADHGDNITGIGQFSISPAGTLACIPGALPVYPELPLAGVGPAEAGRSLPSERQSWTRTTSCSTATSPAWSPGSRT